MGASLAAGSGRDPECCLSQQGPARVSGVSSPQALASLPLCPGKGVEGSETTSRVSRFPLDGAVSVPTSTPPAPGAARPPTLPSTLRPPGQHRLPLTTSFPVLLTHCFTPCYFGQTFSLGLTGFPGFPATFHLHSVPIQCSPSPSPPPVAPLLPVTLHNTKGRSSLARVASPLSPATSCHFWTGKGCVWISGSSKDCLNAGLPCLDPWEQGLGGGSCCGPVSVQPPLWRHCGMLAPQTAPKPDTAHHGPMLAPGMLFPEF